MVHRSRVRLCTLVAVGMLAGTGTALSALPVHAATVAATCGAKSTSHAVAPGLGNATTVSAASAGTVTLLQDAQASLQVQSVAPATGWTDQVTIATGVKVHVGFRGATKTSQVRIDARLNAAGTTLTVITVTCV